MARPTEYTEEYHNPTAMLLYSKGLTDDEVAMVFGDSVATIHNWKHEHPEFLDPLRVGKDIADDIVERKLFERATGYSHPAVKIFNADGQILEAPYVEHYPPDTGAIKLWLMNRRAAQWKEKQPEGTANDGGLKILVENINTLSMDNVEIHGVEVKKDGNESK